MLEAHNSRYSIHLGFPKMYHDLKEILLVERHEKECRRLCGQLSKLSAIECQEAQILAFYNRIYISFSGYGKYGPHNRIISLI